eukprot:scaffold1236_cov503-Prasinococcus_capsulatus_cf.AAC.8
MGPPGGMYGAPTMQQQFVGAPPGPQPTGFGMPMGGAPAAQPKAAPVSQIADPFSSLTIDALKK